MVALARQRGTDTGADTATAKPVATVAPRAAPALVAITVLLGLTSSEPIISFDNSLPDKPQATALITVFIFSFVGYSARLIKSLSTSS